MTPFIRAFVAVEINEEVRRKLADVQATLRKTGAHVAWVAPQNIHISLAFLGDIVHEQVVQVSEALDNAASGTRPFYFEVTDIGAFGARNSPRVIWAGARGVEPLKDLRKRVADGIRSAGIELETREFSPHLTLGRVKSSRGRREIAAAMEQAAKTFFGRVDVARVLLMKSVLHPAGSQYSVLREAPLKG